ncbi:MAG: hypothetical protein AAB453_01395 [Patescibacteria group bacterium]
MINVWLPIVIVLLAILLSFFCTIGTLSVDKKEALKSKVTIFFVNFCFVLILLVLAYSCGFKEADMRWTVVIEKHVLRLDEIIATHPK